MEDKPFYAVKARWKPVSRKNKNIFWEGFQNNHLMKIGYTFLTLVPKDDKSFFAKEEAAFRELKGRKKIPEDLDFPSFIPEIKCKDLNIFRIYGENLKEDLIVILVDEDELEKEIGEFKSKIEGFHLRKTDLSGTRLYIETMIANQWNREKPIPWRKKTLREENDPPIPNPPDRQTSFEF